MTSAVELLGFMKNKKRGGLWSAFQLAIIAEGRPVSAIDLGPWTDLADVHMVSDGGPTIYYHRVNTLCLRHLRTTDPSCAPPGWLMIN